MQYPINNAIPWSFNFNHQISNNHQHLIKVCYFDCVKIFNIWSMYVTLTRFAISTVQFQFRVFVKKLLMGNCECYSIPISSLSMFNLWFMIISHQPSIFPHLPPSGASIHITVMVRVLICAIIIKSNIISYNVITDNTDCTMYQLLMW